MRFTEALLNSWLDDLAAKTAGGRLSFYGGEMPSAPTIPVGEFAELVSCRLPNPAFRPAVGGRVLGLVPEKAMVMQSGTVRWARLYAATGEPLADFKVAKSGAADIIIERTELSSGGKFSVNEMVLALPLGS